MLKLTRDELLIDQNGKALVDFQVKRFAALESSKEPYFFLRREVQEAFDPLSWPQLLTKKDYRPAMALGPGGAGVADVRTIAGREERVRALGRELQLIASSYETPVLSPDYGDFPEKSRAVIRIWQAGTGATVRTGTGFSLRSLLMDQGSAEKTKIREIGDMLKQLIVKDDAGTENREDFVAAVWRYSHGERYVRKLRPEFPLPLDIPEADIGTERQFLKKRYTDIETQLDALWQMLIPYADPNTLKNSEIVWFDLPDKTRDELLPDNVRLWAYVEKMKDGKLSGDIGLQWNIGMDPVLPSLCTDVGGAVEGNERDNLCQTGSAEVGGVSTLGGSFPPASQDGTGLCTEPFQRMGYLCRPLTGDAGTDICKQEVKPSKDKILLSACTQDTGTRATLMGPDACMDMGWKDAVPFDPQKNCKVDLTCASLGFGGAQTLPKEDDGTIQIKVKSSGLEAQSPPIHLILHELAHARQSCEMPPNFQAYSDTGKMTVADFTNVCCTNEGEAYKAQCEAYEQDGMLRNADGSPILLSMLGNDGKPTQVELNLETCWQLLTDASCRERSAMPVSKQGIGQEIRCPNTFTFNNSNTLSIQNAAFSQMTKIAFDRLPKGMARTCADVLERGDGKIDPRIIAAQNELGQVNRQVCDPNRTTQYQNTIGGSMCYINQCLEQSIEDHRLIPGRQTFTAGEQAFTAEACIPPGIDESSLTNTPLAASAPVPPYRPGLLIQSLDAALCQQNGLPPDSPPSRCAFSALRTLTSPEEDILKTALSLWQNPQALGTAVTGTERLSEALGTRVASELYRNYLDATVPKLATLTTEAASLLRTFLEIDFSTAMCSLRDTAKWQLGQPICKPLPTPPAP